MIDNIRFNLKFKVDENWFSSVEENMDLNIEWSNKTHTAYSGKLYFDKSDKNVSKCKKPSLFIDILHSKSDSEVKVIITNSLRRWFFNGSMIREFTKETFKDCLVLLSEKLNVPIDILLEAKVTRVEYGGNMSFREAFRCFITCIHEHKDYTKKCLYGNETVEFKGDYKSVIFYDKITEEKQKSKKFSARTQKQLNDKVIYVRYEVKIKKVSGVPVIKKYMSYLKDIITNWNFIADLWVEELDKITFMNDMNPNVYDYLKDAKIKPINEYLIYLGMEKLGLNNWQLILKDRMFIKSRKSLMDKHRKIYDDFKSKIDNEGESFSYLFKLKVKEKAIFFKT